MLVKALIRSVVRGGSIDKPFVTMTIETEQPLAIAEIRMFKNSINDGTVGKLEALVGQTINLPLNVDLYQGRIQYQIPFNAVIETPAKQVKAA